MKNKDNILDNYSQEIGIFTGLFISSGIIIYDRYSDDIIKKTAELYDKVQPYVQPYINSLNSIDPDLAQISFGTLAVSVLSTILAKLIKKDIDSTKKIESSNNLFSCYTMDDLSRLDYYASKNNFEARNNCYGISKYNTAKVKSKKSIDKIKK